jgi:hypothetical protein
MVGFTTLLFPTRSPQLVTRSFTCPLLSVGSCCQSVKGYVARTFHIVVRQLRKKMPSSRFTARWASSAAGIDGQQQQQQQQRQRQEMQKTDAENTVADADADAGCRWTHLTLTSGRKRQTVHA